MVVKIYTDEFSKSFNLEFLPRESRSIKMMKNWTCAFYNLANLVVQLGIKTMYYKEFLETKGNYLTYSWSDYLFSKGL